MNQAAFTPEFQQFTGERIGAPLEVSEHRIVSSRIRPSMVVFTLTRNMCDCDSLIGHRDESAADTEASADDWLGWLRDLPGHAPHITRLAVLHAWSPDVEVTPAHAKGIKVRDVTEKVLRGLRDDSLLTIDYPRSSSAV